MQERNQSCSLAEFVGIRERAKVLLLGVFHFAYPNLDVFKHEQKVDMLSERRRAEAAEVVERLAAFRPTKVAMEARSEHEAADNEERNLRIFANLKRITESPDDRILVVFGAGHVPILRHAIACSPKHELVDLRAYLA